MAAVTETVTPDGVTVYTAPDLTVPGAHVTVTVTAGDAAGNSSVTMTTAEGVGEPCTVPTAAAGRVARRMLGLVGH